MRKGKLILIVEDEPDLAELLKYNLDSEGYTCRCATDGTSALEEVRRIRPDLIILDRMLPEKSGDEVIAQLKSDSQTGGIPIIMLTAKGEETDQLVGFALGADDYVTKPFSTKVLLARVAAMVRRSTAAGAPEESLSAGLVCLDQSRHEVRVDGKGVAVTNTEFKILQTLMSARERVLDRDQLINAALGHGAVVTDRTIDVHIAAIRKKLGAAAAWLQTVRGVGYTFRPPD